MLDNAYRASTGLDQKLKIAESLNVIIGEQNKLFQATQDIDSDKDIIL
jgi:hypothetical protein